MPVVTKVQLENAQSDALVLADVVNGSATLNGDGTLTSRLGTALKTLRKIIDDLATQDIGVSAAAQINRRVDVSDYLIKGNMIPSSNLFDIDDADVAIGSYVSDSTGALVYSGAHNATGFIKVEPSTNYIVSYKNQTAFYDDMKVFISGIAGTWPLTVTSPAGAKYARFTVIPGNTWDSFQVNKGSTLLPYEAYQAKLVSSNLVGLSVEAIEAAFLSQTKNLFDHTTATAGSVNGSNGNVGTDPTYMKSDFIRVEPGEVYNGESATSNMRSWAFYNEAKLFHAAGSLYLGNSFTVPAGSAFVRLTVTVPAEVTSFQLEKSAVKTSFQKYGWVFNDGALVGDIGALSKWNGLKWGAIGDSVTVQTEWQFKVIGSTGLEYEGFGASGTKISGADTTAMCSDTRINAVATDKDLVTVMGGINDWGASVALGTINSTNNTQFYGALNQMIEKLMTRFPTKRIIVFTPTYADYRDYPGNTSGWADAYTNLESLTISDYAEAVRLVCKKYGVPVVDLCGECGWNRFNAPSFTSDGVHPSGGGGPRMANVIIGRLHELQPIN